MNLAALLREPLLHFLVIAILVLGLTQFIWPPQDDNLVVVDTDTLDLYARSVAGRSWSDLDSTEQNNLADDYFTEEVLVREALALGLDSSDRAIRVRLAEQMTLFAEQLSDLGEPTEEEISAWFENHRIEFVEPAHISFRHWFFSGPSAEQRATTTLLTLEDDAQHAPDADRFLYNSQYVERTRDLVSSHFGALFADTLFENNRSDPDWIGPLRSDHGWHLVSVQSFRAASIPSLNELRGPVIDAMLRERRLQARREAVQQLKSVYELQIVDPR